MNISFYCESYTKTILHCCKYTSEFVCGVLTGYKDNNTINIDNSFPLFHHNIVSSPLETALSMVYFNVIIIFRLKII